MVVKNIHINMYGVLIVGSNGLLLYNIHAVFTLEFVQACRKRVYIKNCLSSSQSLLILLSSKNVLSLIKG